MPNKQRNDVSWVLGAALVLLPSVAAIIGLGLLTYALASMPWPTP